MGKDFLGIQYSSYVRLTHADFNPFPASELLTEHLLHVVQEKDAAVGVVLLLRLLRLQEPHLSTRECFTSSTFGLTIKNVSIFFSRNVVTDSASLAGSGRMRDTEVV